MEQRDRRNAILNFLGETLWGLKTGLIAPATVLTVLLLNHGASKLMIGAIDAIGMCLMLLPQVAGIYIFHNRKKRKVRLVLWHILALQPFLIIIGILTFFADQLGNTVFRWCVLIAYAMFSLNVGIMVASWMTFLASIFDQTIRGFTIGMAHCGSFLANAGGAILAGWLIRENPGSAVYGWLYLIAGVAGMFIINFWLFIDTSADTAKVEPLPDFSRFLSRFKHSLSDSNFRSFLIGRVLATSGFCVISFFTVYFRSKAGGSLSDGFIVQAMAAMTIGTAVTSPVIGRFGDRNGHRLAILLGSLGQVITFIIILLVPGKVGCVIGFIIAGSCASCSFVSHYNMILETCPHDCHTTHISVANLVIGIPMAVIPFCAGWIAQTFSTRALFIVCLVISLAAFLWNLLKVKEPRTLELQKQPP